MSRFSSCFCQLLGYKCIQAVLARMAKEQWQTRLDPDQSGALEEYRDSRGLNDAEAVRRLIKHGLEEQQHQQSSVTMSAGHVASILVGVGTVGAVAALLSPQVVYIAALAVLGVVGLGLTAWGVSPLLRRVQAALDEKSIGVGVSADE